ncbi:SDR family oxidoreductase [Francisellaceae bacterium]|nr:SDR family oxidoreductase [Francisellaceae bacterium]
MFDKLSLSGQVALVTGANRGIGLAIAKLLKERGAEVIATARKEEDIEILQTQGFISRACDVASIGSIDDLKNQLSEQNLKPTILINNAGVSTLKLLPRLTTQEWQKVMNTNFNACFELTKRFVGDMSKSKFGRIINMSSILGSSPQKGFSHYAASKSAIEGFTRSIAIEYASKGVTANCICPGFVDTEMLDNIGDKGKELMRSSIPMGYLADPNDIAELICFLASPAARYITGECVHINGGMFFK